LIRYLYLEDFIRKENETLSIKPTIHFNNSCVKCKKVEKEMILVGYFLMCKECYIEEFNVNEIKIDTEEHKLYKKWMDVFIREKLMEDLKKEEEDKEEDGEEQPKEES